MNDVVDDEILPALPGFSHEDIINRACNDLYNFIKQSTDEEMVVRETVFSCAALINGMLEHECAQNQIAQFVQDKQDPEFIKKIEFLAVYFSNKAETECARAVIDSPLITFGKEFIIQCTEVVRDCMKNHILELKNQ